VHLILKIQIMKQVKFLLIATFFFCSFGAFAQQAETALVPPPPPPELPAPPPPPPEKPVPPVIMTPSNEVKHHYMMKHSKKIESREPKKPIPPVPPVDLPASPKN